MDKESVPILASYLKKSSSRLRTLIIESLGLIGGREAREVLRSAAGLPEAEEARTAYRALVRCSDGEDAPFFRESAANPDRHIRLACTKFLGFHPGAENLLVLAELATDQDPLVSERAITFLKMRHRCIHVTSFDAEVAADLKSIWNPAPVENSAPISTRTPPSTEGVCV